jgi:hypothetical protein
MLQAESLQFDIPSQPLLDALFAYSNVTQLGVLVDHEVTSDGDRHRSKAALCPKMHVTLSCTFAGGVMPRKASAVMEDRLRFVGKSTHGEPRPRCRASLGRPANTLCHCAYPLVRFLFDLLLGILRDWRPRGTSSRLAQIVMLKCRRHAIDFTGGQLVGFCDISPPCNCSADFRGDKAGPVFRQSKLGRDAQRSPERGGPIKFIYGKSMDSWLHINWARVHIESWRKPPSTGFS